MKTPTKIARPDPATPAGVAELPMERSITPSRLATTTFPTSDLSLGVVTTGKLTWRTVLSWLRDDKILTAEDVDRTARRFAGGNSAQHPLVRIGSAGLTRIGDGKVLLFPGDAQEGNWLSWLDSSIKWDVSGPDGKMVTVVAENLLARTVFYKVGHHSSHNATAKAKGLEMMASQSELIAFIPVDRDVALGRSPKGTWKMPARQLYLRLLDKCQGRVVRSDIGWATYVKPGTRGTEAEFAGMGTVPNWSEWTKAQQAAKHVQITPSYIDFVLE